MSSKKSVFIAILLVICLQVISSLASYIPISGLPGPWIITDLAGFKMYAGQYIYIKIVSPKYTLVNINLLQRGSVNNETLLTNVGLYYGISIITVELPSSGNFTKDSPQNYFAVYSNGARLDYSGTFQIGSPAFGPKIRKPLAGDVLRIGEVLVATWEGSYVPPGENETSFTFVRALLEPAITTGSVVAFNFLSGQDLNFSSYTFNFTLPSTIPNNTYYKFGFLITSNITGYEKQIYSSGTFLILN
ncbi:3260_t:CDS:1 [Diversispora eburnea]|uniref:3260_t:CDS:1 n=1 Tax=Diversispora eburnea TaxID=1213867 RepID=A0A9N8YIM0_9GLOM|nr:3260_t:CDS:1 [Diversispora eburnea]